MSTDRDQHGMQCPRGGGPHCICRQLRSPGECYRAPMGMKEGDVVEPLSSDHVLHCGSGVYQDAIVMSMDPFALCSRSGDMIWRATVEPENFRVTGTPDPGELEAALARWARG